jgi:hypothetical protein
VKGQSEDVGGSALCSREKNDHDPISTSVISHGGILDPKCRHAIKRQNCANYYSFSRHRFLDKR